MRRAAITVELIRAALDCIAPDCDRDTWFRVLAGAKASGLAEADARGLCYEWSARAECFSERAFTESWRSIRPSGDITVGTLFGIAKDHGFRFPAGDGSQASAQTVAAAAAEVAARRQQREAEEARYRERAERAARDAAELWSGAAVAGASPYLRRKGVQGHGVRYLADGTLLVPMRDAAGELQNLQRIAPAKPRSGAPEKRFLPGGRKSGLWHLIGQAQGAAAVLLAEGYATAASVHEATGRPVAVAFDAGNLVHVARALRTLMPDALLLICGDDDRDTEQRTGQNPGREKAAQAARAAARDGAPAGAVFPEGLPAGGTDFNDLAASGGADAVRAIIERAIAAPSVPKPRRGVRGMRPDTSNGPGRSADDKADGGAFTCDDEGDSCSGQQAPRRDAFVLVEDDAPAEAFEPRINRPGVWFRPIDAEGNAKRPVWLCAPLRVTALTRTDDGNGWGVLLEFTDPDHQPKAWAMPDALMGGEGAEWAARLRDMGLRMEIGRGPRTLVAKYINTRHPSDRVVCTDRVGWHGGVYVQPSRSIGEEQAGRRYVFQTDAGIEDTFRQAGTLAQWQQSVSAKCVGNSRLVFAVSCALAGPLMGPLSVQTGGFHLVGDSSLGKTTALLVAASVWGSPKFKQQWRTTDNALEATSAQHNDCLLILDEIGQAEGRIVGECAYMLANEQEKGRSTRSNLLRRRRTWRLLFLSSGEKSLADHMMEAGKRPNEGQLLRMPSVPSDAGCGMGMLEDLHGAADGKAFVEAITKAGAAHFGTAGLAWLQWLAEHLQEVEARAAAIMARFEAECVPERAHPQVLRVGARFAVVAAAGELASKAGITGWATGESVQAVRGCFEAWLAKRGHVGNGERFAMMAQVKAFLEKNGDALFTPTHRLTDDHRANTPLRIGFRRLVDEAGQPLHIDGAQEYIDKLSKEDSRTLFLGRWQYLCQVEAFRREVCRGFDAEQVARLLRDRGHLQTEGDRLTCRQRVPGFDRLSVFLIKPSIFSDDLEDL